MNQCKGSISSPSGQTQFILELNSTIWIKESFTLNFPDRYFLLRLHVDFHSPIPGLHSIDKGCTNLYHLVEKSSWKLTIFPFPEIFQHLKFFKKQTVDFVEVPCFVSATFVTDFFLTLFFIYLFLFLLEVELQYFPSILRWKLRLLILDFSFNSKYYLIFIVTKFVTQDFFWNFMLNIKLLNILFNLVFQAFTDIILPKSHAKKY